MSALSFVLLPRPSPLDGAAIVTSFRELFPQGPALLSGVPKGEMIELRSEDVTTIVAAMPVPVPGQEADQATVHSLSSFRAGGFTLPPHTCHLLVTSLAGPPPVKVLLRHTQIVAAITKTMGAVGVYEGNARATHEPEFYVEVASSTEYPTMLWNGVSIARTAETVEVLTLGMAQLGLPNLLLVARPDQGNDALAFAFDLLAYVVSRGQAIAEGETVGRTEDEHLKVEYVSSPIDASQRVARIVM